MAGTTVRTRIPFGVDSGVVFQLGESLISDQAQAILELVKNSYDAGATYAVVNIVTDQRPPDPTAFGKAVGYIMVSDDGDGMTMNDIKRGWLMIAASAKRDLKREMDKIDEGNRVPLGDKGLGRLSSQRLGNNVEIHTRPVDRDGLSKETHNVAFSWESFRKARSVSQVTAVVESTQGRIAKGTDLVVSGLRDPEYWSGPAQNDLRIRLSQFISPYGGETDFKVSVQFNGTDLELAPLGKSLLSSAQLHFVLDFSGSTLHVHGHVGSNFFRPGSQARTDDRDAYTRYIAIDDGAALIDHILARPQAPKLGFTASPSGQWILNFAYDLPLDRVADAKIKDRVVSPGPFTGEVDAIDVGQSDYEDASTQLSAKQVRDVLAEMAGIRVYRDGFGIRVPKDWLELGKLWTTGTSWYSLRPPTTVRRISISARHNSALEEKTDREGF